MTFNQTNFIDRKFNEERRNNVKNLKSSPDFAALSFEWLNSSAKHKYSYNFDWFGLPIIQVPHDIQALQEIIWRTQPDLIIETGVARGGSLIFSASMLALMDYCAASHRNLLLDPKQSQKKVLGIDIEIRDLNRKAIEAHPLSHLIDLREDSSTSALTREFVKEYCKKYQSVMVILDSNHTRDHVEKELNIYAPLVTKGNYCVVMDTSIDLLAAEDVVDRPWGPGDNPRQAVWQFLKTDFGRESYEIDADIQAKISVTVAIDGYLRRVQ
jgi:cephalosporin hydroxylase